ncbi:fructosamine kinase family protein [Pseudalkalibacillus caeni]|uniref:Fructosamine kinase family protein n=1 Tax=Exobacillus caeni TaxID=2574798 RepID=A0A5R9EY11_9BACL|nr:fructosamine kinase family protein [Pseudalkalibacillus caeni]TLS35741.1 fructosamine kinase family protein [Pseudalkalibacillus caeni]
MKKSIQTALEKIGDPSEIKEMKSVSGGQINDSYYVRTNEHEWFIKMNSRAGEGFFQSEALGLNLLKEVGQARVPEVKGVFKEEKDHPAMLILEWIEEGREPVNQEELGRMVARMHCATSRFAGLKEDNFVGELPQINQQNEDWVQFYGENRLMPQAKIAKEKGYFNGAREKSFNKVIEFLDRWIGHGPSFSLLHGDLWSGNFLSDEQGKPVLIDPAVSYGDREADLAFTELFGGFSPGFYEAYKEFSPLEEGYTERKPIYQLYYLLIHLNIFGEMYGPSVDRILNFYAGKL